MEYTDPLCLTVVKLQEKSDQVCTAISHITSRIEPESEFLFIAPFVPSTQLFMSCFM